MKTISTNVKIGIVFIVIGIALAIFEAVKGYPLNYIGAGVFWIAGFYLIWKDYKNK